MASEPRERDTALAPARSALPKAPPPLSLCRRTPKAAPTAPECEIDTRIHRLYDLTQDKIKLVEESAR